ncbi:LysR family transcriptional regulator [Nocardioides pantholopis]|uniref:LysR family transcriptional regulator n=1 Tax=Nocardioides pantholopis TaxID=2483798 RepID=UPI0013DD8E8B|nr:LysR family transcriptional regulator [Nocardioides pantholopis]
MDLRLLRYFLAVIDHGGVTRAAEALFVAQPSVSQSLRTLELRLGVGLFERAGRQLVLTDAGRELEGRARTVLAEVEGARERIERVTRVDAGRLSVAAVSTLAVHPLASWVRTLLEEHPDLQVHVSEPGSVGGVLAELRDGISEVGLVELPVHEASLETVEIGEEELVLAAGPLTGAGLPDPLPRSQVADLPTGVMAREHGVSTESERTMAALIGRPQLRCAQRQLLWDLVQQDVVVTFVPRAVAERLLPGAVLRSLEPPLSRRVGLAHRPGPLSPAASALLRIALPPRTPPPRTGDRPATPSADPRPDRP